jgi:hypothetical protein
MTRRRNVGSWGPSAGLVGASFPLFDAALYWSLQRRASKLTFFFGLREMPFFGCVEAICVAVEWPDASRRDFVRGERSSSKDCPKGLWAFEHARCSNSDSTDEE